jgi:HEAT repeat protein
LNGDEPQGGIPRELTNKYVEEAIFFVVNWHAASVNMRLYPPSSSMVTDTVEKARGHLEEIFKVDAIFSVSVLENSLLLNDYRLDEMEQQKAPVKSFVQWMNERGLTNLEFMSGVTLEEMSTVFEVLSAASDRDYQNLSEVLVERGVTNVTINQRVYVAISAGEDYADGVRRVSPLDTLKDELLMRYLMGKVDLGQVEDRELVDVLSDQGKVGGLLSTFIREEGSEGGILVRSQKAEEALNRLAEMVDQVEDEGLREILSDQIGGIIAEMTPREMTSMLVGEGPENLDIRRIRESVVTMLADNQLLEMVDSLIDEYQEMKTESDELETEWQKEKLRNLNELLVDVREERGEQISEAIDLSLETAGIADERDPETGRRVLSAYQLLGGPLEEEFVELAEGIDQTVSQQIRRLYAMEETELAAGMLVKLADNLKQESPRIRRFAAMLVKETLEGLEREYQLVAAGALEQRLIEDVEAEQDYAAFIPQVDAVAILARAYMQEGMSGRASDILDLLKEQAVGEHGKGQELVRHAKVVLEKLTGPAGMVDAQALLLDEDEEKRMSTVRALASLGPSALSPLVDLVKDRGQVDLRDRALEALKSAGPAGVEALLIELKAENPWYIHRNVLNVVADLKLTEAVDDVGLMVSHPDERIRREAVRSLARIGSKSSVTVVMNAANDPSPAVRRTAVRVLGMFGDSSVAPFLLDLINAQGPRGREEDQAVAEAACLALGDLRDSAHVPQLVDLLSKGGLFKKARPDEIRASACIALGTLGDQGTVPVLQRATRDPSIMVRTSAEKALRKLTGVITAAEPVSGEVTPEVEEEEEPAAPPAWPSPVQEGQPVAPELPEVESVAPGDPGELAASLPEETGPDWPVPYYPPPSFRQPASLQPEPPPQAAAPQPPPQEAGQQEGPPSQPPQEPPQAPLDGPPPFPPGPQQPPTSPAGWK